MALFAPPVLRDVLLMFVEAVPRGMDYHAIKESLQPLANVSIVHSLHVWALTMDKMAVSLILATETGPETRMFLSNGPASFSGTTMAHYIPMYRNRSSKNVP